MKTTFMILILTTVSPGDHQRHVEAQHEGEGNPTVEVSKVDTDLLKVLFHHLVLAEVEAVEQADTEVEDPEEEEVSQHSLVDASFPEAEQSEKGSTPARGVDVVNVGHRHPQQSQWGSIVTTITMYVLK